MRTMKNLKIFFVFLLMIATAYATCPTTKKAKKLQENILRSLKPNYVVAEGRYTGFKRGQHRFTVIQSWKLNNGNLSYGEEIAVLDPTNCISSFGRRQSFFLILQDTRQRIPAPELNRIFTPVTSPVNVRKSNHRSMVWDSVCGESSEAESCKTQISRNVLKPMVILYRGMNTVLRCKVLTGSRVTKITWYKDGVDIDAQGGGTYAVAGIFVYYTDSEKSDMVIVNANSDHTGNYKCVAEDETGYKAEAITKIRVLGKGTDHRYTQCPPAQNHFCLNHGQCRILKDLQDEPFCECHQGFEGERCGFTVVQTAMHVPVEETFDRGNEEVDSLTIQITGLKVGLVALSLLFIVTSLTLYLKCQGHKQKLAKCSDVEKISNNSRTSVTIVQESKNLMGVELPAKRGSRMSTYSQKSFLETPKSPHLVVQGSMHSSKGSPHSIRGSPRTRLTAENL